MSQPTQHPSSRHFESELEIAAPRSVVWEAIASGEGICRWFAPQARCEPRVGGALEWQWSDELRWPLTIEKLEPGQRLLARYDGPVQDQGGTAVPLFVDFALSGEGGKTTLRLVHSGFGPEADFDQEYDGISRGWPVELRSLQLYAEHHAGHAREVAWSSLSVSQAQDAWRLLTSQEGLAWSEELTELGAGESFQFQTVDGDRFEGEVLLTADHTFTAVIENWNHAFLRCSIDDCGGGPMLWLWLSTWDGNAQAIRDLQQRWDQLLQRLFAAKAEAEL